MADRTTDAVAERYPRESGPPHIYDGLHASNSGSGNSNSNSSSSHRAAEAARSSDASGSVPLGKILSLHTTPPSSAAAFEQAGQAGGSAAVFFKNVPLPPRGRQEVTAAVGGPASPPLNAAALCAASTQSSAAADNFSRYHHDPVTNADEDASLTATGRESSKAAAAAETAVMNDELVEGTSSSVTTPCFSAGARSPRRAPSSQTLPLRPKPQRVVVVPPPAEATDGSTMLPPVHAVPTLQRDEDEDEDENGALAATRRQREVSDDTTFGDDEENEEEEEEGVHSSRSWRPSVLRRVDAAVTLANGAAKPTLSPHHSHVPWRLTENSTGHVEDRHASLPSFDSGSVGGDVVHTRSPPPPRSRVPLTEVTSSSVLGTAVNGATVHVDHLLTSPLGEQSTAASTSSETGAVSSGSYAGSGIQDPDTAAVLAAMSAAAATTAARFGGGGVLRHNPANLTFSGSGSGSQAGEAAIDRSVSSHFSVPSRGAASLSPPYLGGDEENGELAVVFYRDGPARQRGGSPTSPFTAAAAAAAAASAPFHSNSGSGIGVHGGRGGVQMSPTHFDMSNVLDETFGTLVSTMSTTFSTTTNSVGDGEQSSPGDTHRAQMAAQMRQALLQTLGLNLSSSGSGSSNSVAQGGIPHSRQRSDKAASLTSAPGGSADNTIVVAGAAGAGAAAPPATAATPFPATTGVAPVSPMRVSDINSTYHYVPLAPHLGHSESVHAHHLATPPTPSRLPSSAAINLASSASLLTNSITSPTTAAQSRSVAAMFAAFTTPGPRTRSAHLSGSGLATINGTFFDIDSGAEEEEGEGDLAKNDGRDMMHRSLSDEGSRLLSMSVSNPLVYEDLPSSEISVSQPFTAAVQPPPSLQLAHPSHRQSLTVNFTDLTGSRRSPVSGTPTCSNTKLNTTADDLFSNSTSSLLPPVLKSTARGGEQASLEAAAAEAVREVNRGDYAVDDEDEAYGDRIMQRAATRAASHPPPLVLSPVARTRPTYDADRDIILASTSPGISPLNIEGVASRMVATASRGAALPLRQFVSLGGASTSPKGAEGSPSSLPMKAAAADAMAVDVDEVVVERSTAAEANAPPPQLEWSGRSLPTPTHVGRFHDVNGDGDDVNGEDEVSGTATTRGPHSSSSSSQIPLQAVGSINFGEAPEMLLETAGGQVGSHSRRDFVCSASATFASIGGLRAAAVASAQQQQQQESSCHTDPTASTTTTVPSVTAMGDVGHGPQHLPSSRPASTTTTNGDLSASTSTRAWMDGFAASAAGLLRRHGGEEGGGLLEEAERSPVGAGRRLSQFATVPLPCLSKGSSSGGGGGAGGRPTTTVSAVFGEQVTEPQSGDNEEEEEGEEEWGEPTSAVQQQQQQHQPHAPPPPPPTQPAVADDKDEFAEPVAAPHAKRVTFADPSTTQFTDPPPSPWTGEDFFYGPNYARMAFKNVADAGAGDDEEEEDKDDAAVLRAVPSFRFTHRSANAHGSPAPQQFAQLSAPSWSAWSRGGDVRTKTRAETGPTTTQQQQQQSEGGDAADAARSPVHNDGDGDDDDVPGGRAPRVFFTKERLASRAALMEARRATAAAKTEKTGGGLLSAPTFLPAPPTAGKEAALAGTPTAARSAGTGLRISLAPPPSTAAAPTVAVVLPDFAAPETSAPSASAGTAATPSADPNDGDDDFGGWVQQNPASPSPNTTAAAARADAAAPFTLTSEWCVQRAAELKRGGSCVLLDSATAPHAFDINTARAEEVLNTVFGDDIALSTAASPKGDSGAAAASVNADLHTNNGNDADDATGSLGATKSTAPPLSAELRGVDGVLEALSFVSLTQRNGGYSIVNAAAASPVTANAGGAAAGTNPSLHASPGAIEEGGFVVPWRTRTTAAPTPPAGGARWNSARVAEEGEARADRSACGAEELADPRLRLTRHLLFPEQSEGVVVNNAPATTAAGCSVGSFMGTRRLPDAPTAAQWTERDVVLAVQQEQRRMAQESEGAVETERLEDVLRFFS